MAAQKPTWVIAGATSLMGKELREVAAERKLPVQIELLSGTLQEAELTEEQGELSVLQPLSALALDGATAVFLAGTTEGNLEVLRLAKSMDSPPALVDIAGDFENEPNAFVRSPIIEDPDTRLPDGAIHVLAHPAAVALSRLLLVVHRASRIRRAVANIFEPASARGKKGLDEMHKQAVSLFTLKQMPEEVFDTQAAFNVLPRYGEEAPEPLSASAGRIERHLASLLGPHHVPLPSVRLLQASTFHGYVQSVWVEFENRPDVATLEAALKDSGADFRGADLEPASNVSTAGQSGIIVSDIAVDPADPQAIWFFLGSDNFRTTADNALLVAGLLSKGSAGKP